MQRPVLVACTYPWVDMSGAAVKERPLGMDGKVRLGWALVTPREPKSTMKALAGATEPMVRLVAAVARMPNARDLCMKRMHLKTV